MSGFNRLCARFAGLAAILGVIYSAMALGAPIVHNGATFEVQATAVDHNTAAFTYTADLRGWNVNSGTDPLDFIIAIGFKLSGYTVDTVDSFATTATGNWVTTAGPSNANGCSDGGNDTFICAENAPTTITAGILTWNFTVTFTTDVNPDDFLALDNHIGAFFKRCADKNNGSRKCGPGRGLSESTSFNEDPPFDVPVPGTVALFGLGLIGLGLFRRRRQVV